MLDRFIIIVKNLANQSLIINYNPVFFSYETPEDYRMCLEFLEIFSSSQQVIFFFKKKRSMNHKNVTESM